MKLTVQGRTFKVNKDFLEKVANAAFSYLNVKKESGEIEVAFVSEGYIRGLNREYRSIDKATDVLSFNVGANPLLGQIFICYTYTKKQSTSLGKEFVDEVALLLVHGILHIYGHDHLDEHTENVMQEMEKTILGGIGIKR